MPYRSLVYRARRLLRNPPGAKRMIGSRVSEYRSDTMTSRRKNFFVSGGTLPRNSASYLERKADKVLFDSLLAGNFCYVLNPRQVGKSSLSVHTIERLDEVGVRTAFVDLSRIGGRNVTPEQWYFGLAFEIARELDRLGEATVYWKQNGALSPVQRLFGLIHKIALQDGSDPDPLVVFIDEIDATRSLPFEADEFFAAIRECFNRRVSEPAFEGLTFCLLGVAVPSDLIGDRTTTPFNIGERVTLEDFTLEELSPFARELGPKGAEVLARVHHWTGGHPFLSQSLCRSITGLEGVPDRRMVDALVGRELFDHKAREANINLSDVANIALHYGEGDEDRDQFRADVLSVYQRVLARKEVPDDESNRAIVRLKLSGIVRTDGRRLHMRNRIYETVFDRAWIDEHMPEQELRRQVQSFRRGAVRTALVSGTMLAALGSFAVVAWRSRIDAQNAQNRLKYELYVSDMNRLPTLYENGDAGGVEAILNRHRNSPYRGFEWGFWLGRYHDAPEEYTLDYEAPGKSLEGLISTDTRELCIMDSVSGTLTIVDRSSKRVVKQAPYSDPRLTVPLLDRWVQISDVGHRQYKVVDIKTGELVSHLGDANHTTIWIYPVAHSNYVVTGEGTLTTKTPLFINVWDAATGQKVFSYTNPWKGGFSQHYRDGDLVGLSRNGRYLLGMRGPLGNVPTDPGLAREGEVILTDLRTGKVVDNFHAADFVLNRAPGSSGRYFFFDDRGTSFLRDVVSHRSTIWDPGAIRDWQVLGAVISGDYLVTLINGGRCIVRDLTGKRPDMTRDNVFSVAAGPLEGQYLACSTSVRLYDAKSHAGAEKVANGSRVTRYEKGILNFYTVGRSAIERVDENDFHKVDSMPAVGGPEMYTYTGRWYLTHDQDGRATLHPSEKGIPSVELPFLPAIWSGAASPDSIVLWRFDRHELVAYSATMKKNRWQRTDLASVSSLWVSPDGARLFVANDRTVTVYSMADGKLLGVMDSHNRGPLNLTFSADVRYAFTCGGDGKAVMWEVASLRKIREFRGNEQQAVTSADISPDGRRVVTTNRSGAWQLWDAATGSQLLDTRVSATGLSSAIFCADGKRIITGGGDGQIRVWRCIDADPTTYIPIDDKYLAKLHR